MEEDPPDFEQAVDRTIRRAAVAAIRDVLAFLKVVSSIFVTPAGVKEQHEDHVRHVTKAGK